MRDDRVPEEGQQAYTPLLTALRSSAHQRAPITATEQGEIIARVRDRLAEAAPVVAPAVPDVTAPPPRRLLPPSIPAQHPRTPMQWHGKLLAGLAVLGLILVTGWALFMAFPFSHGVALPPIAAEPAPSAQAEAGGLEASMRVLIDGPYFLSELLPVDVSLTNHTQQTVRLLGIHTTANLCHFSALMVQVTAGSYPTFTFPDIDRACDQVLPMTEVQPGETLTIHQYVPMTSIETVILTMQGGSDGGSETLPSALDGHWPSVKIQVLPQVPQNRKLALQNEQGQVIIETPVDTQPHLLYMQSIACENYSDGSNIQWTPLATNVLKEPGCPAAQPQWKYIVSAPGYAIVSGSQPA